MIDVPINPSAHFFGRDSWDQNERKLYAPGFRLVLRIG